MANEIIGAGEIATKNILKGLFPTSAVHGQVPLRTLVRQQYISSLSDRQQKETIDIVVERNGEKPMAIRVQDRHHMGGKMSSIDKIQERELMLSGLKVIDIWYYEAPQLFKDRETKEAEHELKKILKLSGIKI